MIKIFFLPPPLNTPADQFWVAISCTPHMQSDVLEGVSRSKLPTFVQDRPLYHVLLQCKGRDEVVLEEALHSDANHCGMRVAKSAERNARKICSRKVTVSHCAPPCCLPAMARHGPSR